jgi:hypothetical protein
VDLAIEHLERLPVKNFLFVPFLTGWKPCVQQTNACSLPYILQYDLTLNSNGSDDIAKVSKY